MNALATPSFNAQFAKETRVRPLRPQQWAGLSSRVRHLTPVLIVIFWNLSEHAKVPTTLKCLTPGLPPWHTHTSCLVLMIIWVCLSCLWHPRWLSGKESSWQCRRCKRPRFDPWVGKIPWSRKLKHTPIFLPGNFHGQRSLVGCKVHEAAKSQI